MITFTLFPVTSVRKFLFNVIGFTIFYLSEVTTGGVLLVKVFLEISQNSQENTYGKVSFLIKLHAEVTTSDLSRVFSWKFLVYFISIEKRNKKWEIPWWSSNIYFFARVSICYLFDVKDFKRNLTDCNNEFWKHTLFTWKQLKVDYSKNI